MLAARRELDAVIERVLAGMADRVERMPGGGWCATAIDGACLTLRARAADADWIEVAASGLSRFGLQEETHPWSLLGLNTRVEGSTRVARLSDGTLGIRADLFVGAGDGEILAAAPATEAHVAAVCEEVRRACLDVTACQAAQPRDVWADAAGTPDDERRLARECAEAGWPGAEDGAGGVRVWLDGSHAGGPARLTRSHESHLRVVAPLLTAPLMTDASRAAVADLLLRVSSTVRAVKGVLVRSGDDEYPAVASAWGPPVHSPASLGRALSAVAVACGFVWREAQALQDEALAGDYLALRHAGWRSGTAPADTEEESAPCLQLP